MKRSNTLWYNTIEKEKYENEFTRNKKRDNQAISA